MLQNAGIWGTASQCLNWANSSASSSQVWSTNSGTGFWDPTPIKSSTQPAKQAAIAKPASSQQQQQQQQQNNNKASKNKNKREEELVKKLFEQNTAKTDEFTQWCNKALSYIQASVDSKYLTSNFLIEFRLSIFICICSPYVRWILARHRIGV